LPRLVGLIYPACAQSGAAGIPEPTPPAIVGSRNGVIMGVPGRGRPEVDIPIDAYTLEAQALYDLARRVILAQPRVFLRAEDAAALWFEVVARSRRCNFPDLVTLRAEAARDGGSYLTLAARAVHGRLDFGVNQDRLLGWLSAIQLALPRPPSSSSAWPQPAPPPPGPAR
jgi:hypothetical protein